MINEFRLFRWPEQDREEFEHLSDVLRSLQARARQGSDYSVAVPRAPDVPTDRERAQVLYRQRRARNRAFPKAATLFQEPAWDILLDLFIAAEDGKQISISSVCVASCAPPTTGLRWVRILEKDGLVVSTEDLVDRRRRFVALTDKGIAAMRAYMSAI